MDISQLIAARPTQRQHRAAWYSELLDAAEHECLSVAEFAERLGVVKETIYAWRRRRAFAAPVEHRRESALLQLDETPVKCRLEQEHRARTKVSQSYLWVFVNPVVSGVVFRFSKGRSTDRCVDLTDADEMAVGQRTACGSSRGAHEGLREEVVPDERRVVRNLDIDLGDRR